MIRSRGVDRPGTDHAVVAVWSIGPLDQSTIAAASRIVSADELARMDRGRDVEARERRLVTRGAVRHLVAERLGVDPRDVSLTAGEHGKPVLATQADAAGVVQFNVAHTRDLSLIAISDGVPVGIDTEGVGRALEIELADRICTRSERRRVTRLARADESAARELLRTYWVRKEAVAKADGRGLQLPVVRVGVHDAPRVRCARDRSLANVTVHDLDVGAAHLAAVAWAGSARIDGGVRSLTID